ncbi:glycosyltransferase [Desulfoplanes formicivorans]|nr:glycosyltransferase [Desulfoplanes formicivorans]
MNNKKSSMGGAELQFVLLANHLAYHSFSVDFIVNGEGQETSFIKNKIKIHSLFLKYLKGKKKNIFCDWIKLFLCLRKIDADIYMIKTPRHLLFLLAVFNFFYNKKIVFVGQIDEDVMPSRVLAKDGVIGLILYRLGLTNISFTIAQNYCQLKGFVCSFNQRSVLVRNYTSLNEPCCSAKKKYILWVGNNHAKKHPELFIKLAQELPEFHFVMIMSTTPQKPHDDDIIEMTRSMTNISYLGYIPFSSIGRYFCEASLFVGTSDMEGFPNTYLQAWQTKTPVVSLYVDPDCVITTYNLGKVSKTFEQLCVDVKTMMINKSERLLIGDNCFEYIGKFHSQQIVTQKYMSFFNYLMKYDD